LQEILLVVQSVFADWGMGINIPKTKVMQLGAQGVSSSTTPMLVNGIPIESVSIFRYFGSY
jgi:hypothetical protein